LLVNQREQAVSCSACNNFEPACVSNLPEGREQVAFPFINKKTAAFRKQFEIKLSESEQRWIFAITLNFTSRQVEQKVNMSQVTLAQKLVLQHSAKRGRERHRELEGHAVAHQSLHHFQQRNVRLGYCFEEPVFLEKLLVFWMSNERKMRVKNEREITHRPNRRPENGNRKEKKSKICPGTVENADWKAKRVQAPDQL
jgi:hypothetical protein